MKQARTGGLSPKTNKILLIVNVILFFGAIVLAILNVHLKEYTPAVAMLIVMLISGANTYGCWKRLKKQIS